MTTSENNDHWQTIAVDHVKRLVVEADKPVEREHTIFLMRNTQTGELKRWETLGRFTLEQVGADSH